jgi:transcription antitermination factor NusG
MRQGQLSEGSKTNMGYSLFSVGERVCVTSGSFRGTTGIVVAPVSAQRASGVVVLSSPSELSPVTISATVDGHPLTLRVPPELLGRDDD